MVGLLVTAVHPRMGGEHRAGANWTGCCPGSSPHGRGTPFVEAPAPEVGRFIPAWAGNTWQRSGNRPLPPVHPRMGGEHPGGAPVSGRADGSSPHGRGTLDGPLVILDRRRFIPAWAGNTCSRSHERAIWTVHPRMGGEHSASLSAVELVPGSSPHGRGTQLREGELRHPARFIPAWAGNTECAVRGLTGGTVHPRMGGEHAAR